MPTHNNNNNNKQGTKCNRKCRYKKAKAADAEQNNNKAISLITDRQRTFKTNGLEAAA